MLEGKLNNFHQGSLRFVSIIETQKTGLGPIGATQLHKTTKKGREKGDRLIMSPRSKSLIQKSLFILILHGDYVFLLIVHSNVTQHMMRGSTIRNQNKNNFPKSETKQSGLNHGYVGTLFFVAPETFEFLSSRQISMMILDENK